VEKLIVVYDFTPWKKAFGVALRILDERGKADG
jgi:hypothetical protein